MAPRNLLAKLRQRSRLCYSAASYGGGVATFDPGQGAFTRWGGALLSFWRAVSFSGLLVERMAMIGRRECDRNCAHIPYLTDCWLSAMGVSDSFKYFECLSP